VATIQNSAVIVRRHRLSPEVHEILNKSGCRTNSPLFTYTPIRRNNGKSAQLCLLMYVSSVINQCHRQHTANSTIYGQRKPIYGNTAIQVQMNARPLSITFSFVRTC